MPAIEWLTYESWHDFKRFLVPELFHDGTFRRGKYLFRGVRNCEWTLIPAFDRMLHYIEARERRRLYASLLETFKRECEAHDVPAALMQDDARLAALGQHFGLPTRLLDWTDSPYIAAFFAFAGAIENAEYLDDASRVAVWILHLDADVWSKEMGVSVMRMSTVGNVRLRNQGGSFTVSNTPFTSLEQFVEHAAEQTVALTQVSMPALEATSALADLDSMGVNPSRLFPDLTGAAAASKLRILLRSLTA